MRLIIVGKAGELLNALSPLLLMFGENTLLNEIPPVYSRRYTV